MQVDKMHLSRAEENVSLSQVWKNKTLWKGVSAVWMGGKDPQGKKKTRKLKLKKNNHNFKILTLKKFRLAVKIALLKQVMLACKLFWIQRKGGELKHVCLIIWYIKWIYFLLLSQILSTNTLALPISSIAYLKVLNYKYIYTQKHRHIYSIKFHQINK